MSQIIWIARHGNRLDFVNLEWFNMADRPYDPPLSEDGKIQAKELGHRLKAENISHIFASPFLRTVQTAYYVAEILNLPIKIEAGLSEWLNPHWMSEKPAKLPLEVLAEQYPLIDLNYQSCVIPEYPETEEIMQQRTAATAHKLVEQFKEDILIIGHGASVLGTAMALAPDSPPINASFCCLVKLIHSFEGWKMELNGDTSHLSQTENVIRFN